MITYIVLIITHHNNMKNENIYKKHKITTLKTLLILSITSMMLIPGGIIPVHAAPGDVLSTVEINSSTVNGPILSDSDRFGISVANIGDLDGDGINDVIVGAYLDDEGGDTRGTIHIILLNSDGTPKSTVEINDSTVNGPILSDGDQFGSSVTNIGDLDGDGVNDVVVGVRHDGEGGYNRGAIHIILLNSDGTPKSTVEINGSTTNGPILNDSDQFGVSITNIGDLDGDGVNDVAVGAYLDDNGGSNRGAIHIILLNSDGTPKSTVEINDSTTNGPVLSDIDLFGYSVSNIGDLDNDGISDIAVGASGDDEGGDGRGAIHIILLNTDGTPKSTVEINDSTTNGPILSDGDQFGSSVTNIGDLDGDGVNDVAVGAFNADASKGAIHIIFLNTDGTPKSTVEINGSTTNGPILSDVDQFGSSVTNIGDLDGDGVNDIAVGANGDDEGGDGRGAIHIIFLDGIVLTSGDTSTTGTVEILTTCGVQFNSGAPISYGAVLPGDTSVQQTLTLYNSGNIAGDILVSGSDWVDGTPTTQMNVDDTKYSTLTGDYTSKTSLQLTDQTLTTLNPQVNTDTFWQLQANLLDTLFSGSLTQTVDFSVSC